MRILVISNFYPPFEMGGWEQLTQEMVDGLRQRGHEVAVLTSRRMAEKSPAGETKVYRRLRLECEDLHHYHPWTLLQKPFFEYENGLILDRLISNFRPDVIFIHSMWNLPRTVAWQAERRLPGRVVYYIASDWPYRPDSHEQYWGAPARRTWVRPVRRAAVAGPRLLLSLERRRQRLCYEHVLCVSQAVLQDLVQRTGIAREQMRVVHNGIDLQQYHPPAGQEPGRWKSEQPAFLYAGGLFPHKGVHTAIEGFARAAQNEVLQDSTLTIVGSGNPEYEARLRKLTAQLGMAARVQFAGRVERTAMPDLLRRFDVLLVPSQFEALSRMMQEGMACGLIVVGTTSWGSSEILVEGKTGLTFNPEDAAGLAAQLLRLGSDPGLRARLISAGRRTVEERFSIERTVAEVERYLIENFAPV